MRWNGCENNTLRHRYTLCIGFAKTKTAPFCFRLIGRVGVVARKLRISFVMSRWFSDRELYADDLPWVDVRTRVRAEKQVAAVLSGHGVESWAPTAPVRRRWSDRWKVIDWPLFPGYTFARLPRDRWYPILEFHSVYTVVKSGSKAAEIPGETMDDLRRFAASLGKVEADPTHIDWFEPGDAVMITEGPFAGIRAVVTKSEGRKRISVGLEILGRGVMATVPAESVVRVPDELELHDVIAGMHDNDT